MEDELEKGRRLERRRYARISFGLIVIKSCLLMGVLLLDPQRQEVAQAFATASPLLGTMLGVYTAVIAAYMGASAAEQIWKKDDQPTL